MWSGTEIEISLHLIRHGKTLSNSLKRYVGRTEEALSKEGIQDLTEKKMLYPKPDYLFVSPMLRCRQSGEILFPDKAQIVIPEWMEMDFGRFEGKSYEELCGDKDYQAWLDSNGSLPFPEGESREAFMERTFFGYEKMLQRILKELCKEEMARQFVKVREDNNNREVVVEKQNRCVLAVVHGGTIMALLFKLCGGEYFDYQVENGKGYFCKCKICVSDGRIISFDVRNLRKIE